MGTQNNHSVVTTHNNRYSNTNKKSDKMVGLCSKSKAKKDLAENEKREMEEQQNQRIQSVQERLKQAEDAAMEKLKAITAKAKSLEAAREKTVEEILKSTEEGVHKLKLAQETAEEKASEVTKVAEIGAQKLKDAAESTRLQLQEEADKIKRVFIISITCQKSLLSMLKLQSVLELKLKNYRSLLLNSRPTQSPKRMTCLMM